MQISIVGRHFRVTEPIKKYIDNRIVKLAKYDPWIIGARVTLSVEKYRHIVDVTLLSKHVNLKGKGQTNDVYASVDAALARLEKQVQKHRERVKEHRKQMPKEIPSDFSSTFVSPPAKHPKVLKSKGFVRKPMSVEEARMELEILKDTGFLVFSPS